MSSDVGQSQVVGILIGVIIGVVVTTFGVVMQYMLTDREDRKRRKTLAYALLKENSDRIQVKSQLRQRDGWVGGITDEEYDRLGGIMADNCDVLEKSTITAWNSISQGRLIQDKIVDERHDFYYKIGDKELDRFLQEVKRNYEKLTKVRVP